MQSSPGEPHSSYSRVPIGQVLDGPQIRPLDAGETAREAFVLIKLVDAESQVTWSYRTTHAPNREELLGALVVQADLLRKELRDEWES